MARWSRFAPAADRRLVKTLHDGDDDALATIYDAYAERLYDYCMALLGDARAAADVVHDTFIDAARRSPRMRERERLRAWLYAAARRRCLLRQPHPGPMAEDEAFARLDISQQETLFLAYRHDLTGEDLAATLGLTPRRIQSRLKRAERQVTGVQEILTTVPAPALPAALRHRVLHAGTDPELSGYRNEIVARGGALTTDGMPRQPDAPSTLGRRWAIASGGSLAVLAIATIMTMTGQVTPIPNIQWPGESPPRHRQATNPKNHPTRGVAARPSAPPRTQQPSGPERLPSKTPSSPTPRPSPEPGVLHVVPRAIHLGKKTPGVIRLFATKGQVDWKAAAGGDQITLSASSGILAAQQRTTISVTLVRRLVILPGQTTVTVTDGEMRSTVVTVTWDGSIL